MSQPDQPIIELRSVTRTYRMGDTDLNALDDVPLKVNTGDCLCIMGPSGGGKSTMLNLLGCLDQPTKGDYILGGEHLSDLEDDVLSEVRGLTLGFIFQSYNLTPQFRMGLGKAFNLHCPM